MLIDGTGLLPKVRRAYKIKEESAIPLALPVQIALGGQQIDMTGFDAYIERYIALHLDDGQSIFKRVGDKLPKPLSHLRRFESIGGLGVADNSGRRATAGRFSNGFEGSSGSRRSL